MDCAERLYWARCNQFGPQFREMCNILRQLDIEIETVSKDHLLRLLQQYCEHKPSERTAYALSFIVHSCATVSSCKKTYY